MVDLEPGNPVPTPFLRTLTRPTGQKDLLRRGAAEVKDLESTRRDWGDLFPCGNRVWCDSSPVTETSVRRVVLILKCIDLECQPTEFFLRRLPNIVEDPLDHGFFNQPYPFTSATSSQRSSVNTNVQSPMSEVPKGKEGSPQRIMAPPREVPPRP